MIDSSVFERYSLFGGLERGQIDSILPLLVQEVYEAGMDIIVEGMPNDKIWFILEGRVMVGKKGVVLTELQEGDTFGEMEVLDIMPTEATIMAEVHTTVMSLSNEALRKIYTTDIKIFAIMIMNLARDTSRRLRNMNARVTNESPLMDWN